MNRRKIAREHLDSLQTLARGGTIKSRFAIPPITSKEELGIMRAAGFADANGNITEDGRAALDAIRREHPQSSPFAFYRPEPLGWR